VDQAICVVDQMNFVEDQAIRVEIDVIYFVDRLIDESDQTICVKDPVKITDARLVLGDRRLNRVEIGLDLPVARRSSAPRDDVEAHHHGRAGPNPECDEGCDGATRAESVIAQEA
jgi:hypothetical protein